MILLVFCALYIQWKIVLIKMFYQFGRSCKNKYETVCMPLIRMWVKWKNLEPMGTRWLPCVSDAAVLCIEEVTGCGEGRGSGEGEGTKRRCKETFVLIGRLLVIPVEPVEEDQVRQHLEHLIAIPLFLGHLAIEQVQLHQCLQARLSSTHNIPSVHSLCAIFAIG